MMIKKILIISAVLASHLFIQSCYSMCPCCGEEEEKKLLIGTHSSSLSTEAINSIEDQKRPNALESERQLERKRDQVQIVSHINSDPHQGQETEFQQFAQGTIIISCPKDLKSSLVITNQTETSQEIVCKNIFYIKIYGDFADAKTNNAVKQILEYGVVPSDADSLKRKMCRFSDEVKKNVGEDDLCVTSQFFDWIQREIAEKINHEDVMFGQETDTKKTVIVFMIDNGAVLLKGPAKKPEIK